MMLLEWLVLARKPLKWREIQALKSMNTENQSIDFDRQKFLVKDPREIGGSFVKVREDGSVELIHLTAKLYDSHYIFKDYLLTRCYPGFSLTRVMLIL
jgi:hypothetical protein